MANLPYINFFFTAPVFFKYYSYMKHTVSYNQYLNIISRYPNAFINKNKDSILEHYQVRGNSISRFAPVVFMVDYTSQKYIYVNEACLDVLGFSPGYFIEGNLEVYNDRIHPLDFDIINNKVFPECLEYIKTIAFDRYHDFVFSYNYRIRNVKNDYIIVLQRFSYIAGTIKGMPPGVIGVIYDISNFKNDISVIYTIEEIRNHENSMNVDLIFKKNYQIEESIASFSVREVDILKRMAEGKCSKQIADGLKLSINTIHNHRNRKLKKRYCKNSTELLCYALKKGFIN